MKSPSLSPLFLVSAMLLLLPPGSAQHWLQEGQEWHYYVFGGFNPQEYGLHRLIVAGDTLVQGVPCKKVVHHPRVSPPEVFIAYEEGGRVFRYNPYDSAFVKIYDFQLQPGDTLVSPRFRFRIDSVGDLTLHGTELAFQRVNVLGTNWSDLLIIEGVGLVGRPFSNVPQDTLICSYFFLDQSYCAAAVDGWNVLFRCFSGPAFSFDPYNTCGLSATVEPSPAPFRLLPVPADGTLKVVLPPGHPTPKAWLVVDAGGRQRLAGSWSGPTLEVHALPPGIYFLTLQFADGRRLSRKFIIAR
ncbi:MAG: T9SS C-terminal target domain-containing protein [Bacteroidetes bacterium]|nr:MAG: T9SS C-terminal target domain-containing protein [Bacteroidota bacterium]